MILLVGFRPLDYRLLMHSIDVLTKGENSFINWEMISFFFFFWFLINPCYGPYSYRIGSYLDP